MFEESNEYSFCRNDPDRKILITASPFNWLDASIFYVDITGKPYFDNESSTQSYKDKGFNLKFCFMIGNLPAIAFGVNDFAGTVAFILQNI